MKTLACCYTRFSTDQQNQSSTIGQLRAIKAYCEKNNIELIETYIDEAQSGTNMNRKNFQKMLSDAPNALWDTVVVYNMSRLSRSVKDTLILKEEFKRMGKRILSVIENQDESPEGDFFNLITYGMNELFVKQFKRDSWRGLLVNANDCKAQGGIPPLGYGVGKDKKYIIVEEEAKIIRIIFDMISNGKSYKDVSDYLNENGYTNRGKKFKGRFTDILRNEKYTGVYIWNLRECKQKLKGKTNRIYKSKEEVIRIEGGMPQIVDKEIFDKVQKLLDSRKRHYKGRGPKCKYLLSKKLVCGKCGQAWSGEYTFSGGGLNYRRFYKCINKECKNKDINMDYLDWYVKELIKKVILSNNSIDSYQDFINNYYSSRIRIIQKKLDNIEREKKKIKEELADLAIRLQNAQDDNYVDLTKMLGKNTTERTMIGIEEERLKNELVESNKITKIRILQKIRNERKKIKNDDLKEVIEGVVHKIVMDEQNIEIVIDLSYLFQVYNGSSNILITIIEPRENVTFRHKLRDVEFTNEKLTKSLKNNLKKIEIK